MVDIQTTREVTTAYQFCFINSTLENLTKVFQRPAVYLSFRRMAEHFAVLLVALLCLVTTSSCDDTSLTCGTKYPSWLRFYAPSLETKQGTPIKSIRVFCVLWGRDTAGKKLYTYDITNLVRTFVKPEVDNASLVTVYLLFWCDDSPMEIRFNNSRNIVYNNILLFLGLSKCTVSTQSLLVLANATDLRGFYNFSSSRSILPEERKETVAPNVKEISYAQLSLNDIINITGVFNYTQKVFSNLAKLRVYVPYRVKQISTDQWRLTMPNLQCLDLSWNSLTKPPEFPWNNSTLEIFRELRRGGRDGNVRVAQNLYIRELDLSRNKIEDLSSHEFRGFLHKLVLRSNGLRTIGPTCFHGLQGIQSIDLSRNMLTTLPENLFRGLTSLLHVDLSKNRISFINKTLFHGLINIKRIYLNDNPDLSCIEVGEHDTLDYLEVLQLDWNTEIKTSCRNPFSPTYPPGEVIQNKTMASFPSYISNLKKLIEKLHLSNNRTDLDQFLNACEIMLAGNPLPCDCKIAATVKLISPVLEKYPEIKPRFSSKLCDWPNELKGKSILDTNETNQWMTREKPHFCPPGCSCENRCSHEHIVIDCQSQRLEEIPSSMPQGRLIELNLISNHIRDIPPYSYLENVTVLKLTNNEVDQLKDSFLKRLKHVKTLLIDSNMLTSLPEEFKTLKFTTLALSKNNFTCDCNTKWMTHWLLKNNKHITDYEMVFCCSGQSHLLGKPMYNLTDDMFICPTTIHHPSTNSTPHRSTSTTSQLSTSTTPHPSTNTTPHPSTNTSPHSSPAASDDPKPYLTIAITVTSVLCGLLLLTVITVILLYKYQGELKVFMFTRFNLHPFDRIDDSDPNKIYDAFISYSGDDYQWVVNTLQRRLENHNPPYKLCLHHRDFQVGALIQENIFKSVDHSKRMLMVLSPSFAKSGWCLLEFRFAHQKVLQDRTNYLIIILFDDVDMADLDEEIKLYMRTNTFVRVSDERFWQKLFYVMPQPCSAKESTEDTVIANEEIFAEENGMPLTERLGTVQNETQTNVT